jgi:hypothetical protein
MKAKPKEAASEVKCPAWQSQLNDRRPIQIVVCLFRSYRPKGGTNDANV